VPETVSPWYSSHLIQSAVVASPSLPLSLSLSLSLTHTHTNLFQEDVRHGLGIFTKTNGAVYTGEWQRARPT